MFGEGIVHREIITFIVQQLSTHTDTVQSSELVMG